MSHLSVKALLEVTHKALQLELLAGSEGLWHDLSHSRYQKAGLLLTGMEQNLEHHPILILGFTEMAYLQGLSAEEYEGSLQSLFQLEPACIIVTGGMDVPDSLLQIAEETKVPVLLSGLKTSLFLDQLETFIDEFTRELTRIHGVLMDVLGIGVLIIGPSGIGKSEIALELITRGHRLVADDTVEVQKHHPDVLEGRGTPIVKHHMEIRGLGIISIPRLFGPAAVRDKKKIELMIRLEEWNPEKEYERLGLEEHTEELLDLKIPLIVIPVRPGRSVGTIIEVAARDRLLKQRGINSSQLFQETLNEALNKEYQDLLIEDTVE